MTVHYLPGVAVTSLLGRHKEPLLRYRPEIPGLPPRWSHTATWEDIAHLQMPAPMAFEAGWGHRWGVTFKHGAHTTTESAAVVSVGDLLAADPMLTNSWHAKKTSRAGLRYVSSTESLHAHASMFERKLLLALDFQGAQRVAAQPFTLTYDVGGVTRHHTPDFMTWINGTATVINCRPAEKVDDRLLEDAAAVETLCLSRGWGSAVCVGFSPVAYAAVDAWAAHAEAIDHLGYSEDILDRLDTKGPVMLVELQSGFEAVAIARAVIQMLLWDREITVDLNLPFDDDTLIRLPAHVAYGASA